MNCDATRPFCLSSVRESSAWCIVYLRDESILKREIEHADSLSREIRGWKETENSDFGGAGGGKKRQKEQRCRK